MSQVVVCQDYIRGYAEAKLGVPVSLAVTPHATKGAWVGKLEVPSVGSSWVVLMGAHKAVLEQIKSDLDDPNIRARMLASPEKALASLIYTQVLSWVTDAGYRLPPGPKDELQTLSTALAQKIRAAPEAEGFPFLPPGSRFA